jgi:integrase
MKEVTMAAAILLQPKNSHTSQANLRGLTGRVGQSFAPLGAMEGNKQTTLGGKAMTITTLQPETCHANTTQRQRRPRGSGHIYRPKYKTKDGKLRESRFFWIQFYLNGRVYRQNTKSAKKTVAERVLRKRFGEMEVGQFVGPKAERVRFEELAGNLKADYTKKGQRLDRLELSLNYLSKFFTGRRMVDIEIGQVNEYIALRQKEAQKGDSEELATGASNATVNRELAALRRMFHLGVHHKKLLRVPSDIFEMLPESDARQGHMAADQYRRLLQELPGYLKAFVATLYYTGMRLREALGLRWSDIDWLNRRIYLPRRRTKSKKAKVVKIDDELYALLDMQRRIREAKHPNCEWVFFGKTGKRIRSPYGAFRSACKRTGVFVMDNGEKRLPNFHDFRRTFATDMRRAGVSEGVIMDMGGWATREVFERYNIKDESDQEDALQQRRKVSLENSQSTDKVVPQETPTKELTLV